MSCNVGLRSSCRQLRTIQKRVQLAQILQAEAEGLSVALPLQLLSPAQVIIICRFGDLDHEFGWLPAMSGCTLLLAAQHLGARGSAYILRFSQRGAICTVAMVYPKAIHTPALAV